jgi:Mg2+ and Co2+ transporter CorA
MGTRASTFTIWMVAIMLANLVVGLFGMNFALPLPMAKAFWPFWLINILALIVGGVIFFLRRMNKW